MGFMTKYTQVLSVLAAALLLAPSKAISQTDDDDDNEQATLLDVIIVTGLKRKDTLAELPASVTVIDDAITPLAIDPGAAITRAAPNFYFGGFGQPGFDFVNLRGIGPLGQPANSLDNAIGFALNGVGTSAFGFPPALLDVDRIEVLRGPQGTLFGRNALGGVVNVVTNPADGTRQLSLLAEGGTNRYGLVEAVAGGWLSKDRVAARLAGRFQTLDDDIPNVVAGGEEGDVELYAVRGTLGFTLTPRTEASLLMGADRDKRNINYNMFRQAPGAPVSGADIIPESSRDRLEAIFELQHRADAFTFTSTTGVQEITLESRVDTADTLLFEEAFGFSPPDGADISDSNDVETIVTQEFRLNAPEDADVSWVLGANLFYSAFESSREQVSSYSPYSSGNFDTDIDALTLSAFADVSVPLNDRIRVSGGLRLASDEQDLAVDYEGVGFPGTPDAFRQTGEVSDTYLTGRLAMNADIGEQTLLYGSIARGYSSGGYERFTLNAAVGEDTVPFESTTSWAYEIGLKHTLRSGRTNVGASAYFNNVANGQVVVADFLQSPIVFRFENQDYESYGFEAYFRTLAGDNLRLGGGLGFNRSSLRNVDVNAVLGTEDGNDVPGAPDWTGSVDAEFALTRSLSAIVQYQYVGKRAVDIQNTDDLDSYSALNVRLGWSNDRFRVYAFANNLLDERAEYFGVTYAEDINAYVVGPQRVFGAGVGVSF
ncbi:MAG: TonB-dependent receptor plug domain-containing protein [Pseudomonadota bacterium]